MNNKTKLFSTKEKRELSRPKSYACLPLLPTIPDAYSQLDRNYNILQKVG